MQVERRGKAVRYKSVSLSRFMEAVVLRNDAVAMVLADRHGLLLEASVAGPEAHRMAAITAAVADGGYPAVRARQLGFPLTVNEVCVHDARLLLGVVGPPNASDNAIRDAVSGVQRIMA